MRQGLVEEHRPGGAVGVEEGEEGAQAVVERVAGVGRIGDRLQDRRHEGVAGAFHAGDVEALLVAEVVVEERLGDTDGGGDLSIVTAA